MQSLQVVWRCPPVSVSAVVAASGPVTGATYLSPTLLRSSRMVGEAEAQVQVRRSSAKWSAIMSTGCPVGGHLLYNRVHDHENGVLKVGENLSLGKG